jgi:predicted transcriptional regulator
LRKMAAEGHSRSEIAEALGMRLQQIAGRLCYTKTSIRRRPPAPSANPLVDAVRQRAFALNIPLGDLDRSLGDRKIFQQAAGRQRVKHIHIERAVKALGGRFAVQWDDE